MYIYIHTYICTYVDIHVYIGRLGEPSRVCIQSCNKAATELQQSCNRAATGRLGEPSRMCIYAIYSRYTIYYVYYIYCILPQPTCYYCILPQPTCYYCILPQPTCYYCILPQPSYYYCIFTTVDQPRARSRYLKKKIEKAREREERGSAPKAPSTVANSV
jgi:hypothetical protein